MVVHSHFVSGLHSWEKSLFMKTNEPVCMCSLRKHNTVRFYTTPSSALPFTKEQSLVTLWYSTVNVIFHRNHWISWVDALFYIPYTTSQVCRKALIVLTQSKVNHVVQIFHKEIFWRWKILALKSIYCLDLVRNCLLFQWPELISYYSSWEWFLVLE